MTFVTANTLMDGKVAVLIAVDNYSGYVFATGVETEVSILSLCGHIDTILKNIQKNHADIIPLCIMAYGKEFINHLHIKYKGKAHFLFNPVAADKLAMPAARDLLKKLGSQ